jgi:hypothetical protein
MLLQPTLALLAMAWPTTAVSHDQSVNICNRLTLHELALVTLHIHLSHPLLISALKTPASSLRTGSTQFSCKVQLVPSMYDSSTSRDTPPLMRTQFTTGICELDHKPTQDPASPHQAAVLSSGTLAEMPEQPTPVLPALLAMALPVIASEHATSVNNSNPRTVHASTLSTFHAHFSSVHAVRNWAVTTPPDSESAAHTGTELQPVVAALAEESVSPSETVPPTTCTQFTPTALWKKSPAQSAASPHHVSAAESSAPSAITGIPLQSAWRAIGVPSSSVGELQAVLVNIRSSATAHVEGLSTRQAQSSHPTWSWYSA